MHLRAAARRGTFPAMRALLLACVCALLLGLPGHGRERPVLDETSQFIFFSVLEGLFEDGVSDADVNRILLQKPGKPYFHFIYACPICTATIQALETYRNRPKQLYSLKAETGTFGDGLSLELTAKLASDDPVQRLQVINTLVQRWISRRMEKMHLPEQDRASLAKGLEEDRKTGMNNLERFKKSEPGSGLEIDFAAPAYRNVSECAACNGALGKPMKLPGK